MHAPPLPLAVMQPIKWFGSPAAVAGELKWGLPPECATNPLCGGALKDGYGIDVATLQVTPLAACDAPIAEALNARAIDVAELCSTQPAIEAILDGMAWLGADWDGAVARGPEAFAREVAAADRGRGPRRQPSGSGAG